MGDNSRTAIDALPNLTVCVYPVCNADQYPVVCLVVANNETGTCATAIVKPLDAVELFQSGLNAAMGLLEAERRVLAGDQEEPEPWEQEIPR